MLVQQQGGVVKSASKVNANANNANWGLIGAQMLLTKYKKELCKWCLHLFTLQYIPGKWPFQSGYILLNLKLQMLTTRFRYQSFQVDKTIKGNIWGKTEHGHLLKLQAALQTVPDLEFSIIHSICSFYSAGVFGLTYHWKKRMNSARKRPVLMMVNATKRVCVLYFEVIQALKVDLSQYRCQKALRIKFTTSKCKNIDYSQWKGDLRNTQWEAHETPNELEC